MPNIIVITEYRQINVLKIFRNLKTYRKISLKKNSGVIFGEGNFFKK